MASWKKRRLLRRVASSVARNEKKRNAVRRLFSESLEERTLLTVVTGSDPAPHAFDAALSTNISATFDEALNAGTITPQSFVVHGTHSVGQLTGGLTTLTVDGQTATHDPANNFAAGEIVNVTVTGSAMGTSTAVEKRVWQFRTATTAGSGQFEDTGQVIPGGPGFVVFGDADGDGDLDALQGANLWLNDGDANFTDSGQNVGAGQERDFADLDGDGDLDIASSTIWFNDGNGVFTQGGAGGGGGAIDVGDLDGDGDLDIMGATGGYNGNRVFFNNGSGAFTDSGQVLNGGFDQARGLQLEDFDNDGDLDAFSGNWTSPDRLWINDGVGNFTLGYSTPDTSSSQDVDVGDFDNDGDIDVLLGHAGGTGVGDLTSRILLNDGNGLSFTSTNAIDPGRTTWATEVGDMDADGDLDLVIMNRTGAAGSTIWLNDGAANFSAGSTFTFTGDRRVYGGDIGDLNGDGALDIWEANVHPPTGDRIFLNQVLAPDVTLGVDSPSIGETGGSATITASIAAAFAQDVTVTLSASGTASDPDDYTLSDTELVITAGATSAAATLTTADDSLDEADETVDIAIAAVVNGQAAGGGQQVTVTIMDDDDAPTVALAVDNTTIGEDGGTATATATLSAVSGQDVTIQLGATGTATDGADYTLSGSEITISAGSTSGSVTVTSVDDPIDEPDETVVLDITGATGATEDGTQQATITITDDDAPPTVGLSVDNTSIEEDGGVATFTVALSAPSLTATSVTLVASGTATPTDDYTLSATEVVIAAGDTEGTVTVTSVADVNITEGGETVTLDIDTVTGNASEDGVQQATTTIVDDVNGPDVTIAVDNDTLVENAGGTATVTATLANAFSLPVTVELGLGGTATDGADYNASATQIVVAVGDTTGSVTLTVVDDALIEGDETAVVDVNAVINGNEVGDQQVIVTITDDESPPNVTLSVDNATIAEAGAGSATITATLSLASTQDATVNLTVSGTATATDDYTLSSNQIIIPAGSTTGSVTVTAVDDSEDDDDETIVAAIDSVVNANEDGEQEVTIVIVDDDDAPPLPPGPTPPNATSAAAINTIVGYTFGANIPADAANDQTFTVHSSQTGQLVGADTTVTQNAATAIHTPASSFKPGELVQASVTSALGTKAVWQFRTQVTGGLGTFTFGGQNLNNDPSENIPTYGIGLADFDGDGDLDAFFANGNGPNNANEVWLNDGAGVFTDTGQTLGNHQGRDIATGDVDGDGDVDAVVANDNGQANRVWINDGNGNFTSSTFGGNNSERIRLGDLDGDGDLDVFVANGNAGNGVYLNDGTGTFAGGASVGNHASFGVDLGDVDNDGDLDAVVANGNTNYVPNKVWLNDGNGNFTDSGQVFPARPGTSVGLGDLDNDGDLDVVWGYFSGDDVVAVNDGTGVFAPIQNFAPTATYSRTTDIKMGDVDNDGDLDVMVTSQLNRPSIFFTNDGTGNLTQGAVLTHPDGGTNTNSAALGDIDNDGDIDFLEAVGNSLNVSRRPSFVWTNDNPVINTTLSVDNGTIPEAGGVATVTATISTAAAQDVTVNLSISGSATASDDYITSGTSIVIPTGSLTGTATITAVDDTLDDDDETVVVDIDSVIGAQESGQQQVTVTIADDDEPVIPDVTISVDEANIAEDGGVATFTVSLSQAVSQDVTVGLGIGGTASAADFTASGTEVVIASGDTSGSITVTSVDDEEDESDETVEVSIESVVNGNEDGEQSATTTIVDDDGPLSFTATLVPTNSGFVANLSAELDGNDINLHDLGDAGAPDVILTGASGGPVAGSLSVEANSVTFVATGGALPADDYTVTLRSAADGFEDIDARLLDGNGDGTGGDDFTGNFTIAAPAGNAVTLSVPDFVRGPAQDVNVPADATGLPIVISGGAGVRNVTVSLDYDPAKLEITAAAVGANMPAGAAVNLDTSTPGTAVITFTSPADLPTEANNLVTLTASVPDANANDIYRTKQVLNLHSATVTDSGSSELPVIDDDGLHVVSYFGDVSGNARINAADASQVAQLAALLTPALANFLVVDPEVLADVTGNGRVNAADASQVAQVAALLPNDNIPPVPPGVVTTPTTLGPDPKLSIGSVEGSAGDNITVPIEIDSIVDLQAPNRLAGIRVVIEYDDAILTATGVSNAEFAGRPGWSVVNNLTTPGRIIVVAFTTQPTGGQFVEDLVNLEFTINEGAPAGPTVLNMVAAAAGATTELLDEDDNFLVLEPAPTNDDTDEVDGTVTVAGAAGPTVTLSVDNDAIAEAGGEAIVTATLSAAAGSDVTVGLAYTGTATPTDDYTNSGAEIVIAAGDTTGSVTVTAVDDEVDDDDETVVVDIDTVTGATEDGDQQVTVTITDDDAAPLPTVALSVDTDAIAEAGGEAIVTATLSAAAGTDVTVGLAYSGTATPTDDYTNSGAEIVIAAGDTTGSVTVTAVDDDVDDDDETVVVDIDTVTGATEDGDQQVTVTITDDDEGAAATNRFSIPRDLTGERGQEVTVPVNIESIELTQAAQNRLAGIGVVIQYDTNVLTANNVTPGSFITDNSWTLVPNTTTAGLVVLVGFATTPFAGTINDLLANINFTVNAEAPAGETVINIVPSSGPAFTEMLDENDQTLVLGDPVTADPTDAVDGVLTVAGTVEPTVALSVDTDTVAEAGGQAIVTATLSAAATDPVTVALAFSGTATPTDDYTNSGTEIVIPAGDTTGSVTVTAVDDEVDDDDETVVVDIDTVTGATEDGDQQVTVTIADDDDAPLPTVALSVDPDAIAEAGGEATVTATLSAAAATDVTVTLAYSGTATPADDYTNSGAEIVIAAGDTTGSVTVTAVDDEVDDDDETVVVDIDTVTGATEDGDQQVTVTIADDDDAPLPTVALSVDPDAIAEAGGEATVTATLSAAAATDVTVTLAYSGTATPADDYTNSGAEIVIAAGDTTGSVTVTAVDDEVDDDDETVVVDIDTVTGATEDGDQQVTVTIADDDDAPLPTVALSVDPDAIAEAGGEATVTATLSAAAATDVTVTLAYSGTATPADDYTNSGAEIVIAAG